jgi:hypothetical protein
LRIYEVSDIAPLSEGSMHADGRHIFLASAIALALFVANRILESSSTSKSAETFEIAHSDADWRILLMRDQYAVLIHSSPLDHEKRRERSPARVAICPCFLRRPSSIAKRLAKLLAAPR